MTTTVDRVSVIVPTKNRSALLRQALESVVALAGPDLEIELVVADNGSTDDSRDVARALGAKVVDAVTPGAGATRNAGLRAATGDFITFLDDDDVWLPENVRPQLRLLRERPDLDGVVAQIVDCDADLVRQGEPWPQTLPDGGDLFRSFLVYYPQLGATVVRASVVRDGHLFDEALIGDQDWDWHLRLALAHRVGFVPVPAVLFRHRPVGYDVDLQWRRMKFSRRVFWRNVRRGRGRGLGALGTARTFARQRGWYCGWFVAGAAARSRQGEPEMARRAVTRAFLASPLHAAKAAVTDRTFRTVLRGRTVT